MTGQKYDRRTIERALGLLDEGTTYADTSAEIGVWPSTLAVWVRRRREDPSLSWAPEYATVAGAPHGTLSGYWTSGCRCLECRAARSEQAERNSRRIILGHPPAIVDSTGARRRVYALHALGWSRADISAASGVSEQGIKASLARAALTRRKHDAICRAYDALSMQLGPSQWHRSLARGRGWAPPLAWDDDAIDDPAAKPNTGHTNGHGKGSGRRGFASRLPDPDILVAEVNRSGRRVVAERYGSTPDAVWMRLNRAGYRASHTGDIHELPIYRKAAA